MLTPRITALRATMSRDDSGFSLIEVVVAMVVLMIFAGALSVTLLNSLSVSKVSRQRVAASNLAARELEIVRNKFSTSNIAALAIAATSSVTNGNPLVGTGDSVVDGTPYTVQRDVQWLPTGTGVSACDGGALVSSPSLQVFVTVTWPNMRNAAPVRAETVMTPLKGTTDALATAYIATRVQNADGTFAESVSVTAAGPGGTFVHTTDASGCVVFQVGTAGTYNVTLNTAGWVDQTGTQISIKTPVVAAVGTMVTKTMTYDAAATMNVKYLPYDSTYVLPAPLPAINYVKFNSVLTLVRQTTSAPTVTSLWPTTDGYAPWAGACPDSDPASAPTGGGNRGVPAYIAPGASRDVPVKWAPVEITVKTSGGVLVPGVAVTATNASTGASACTVAEKTLALGTTGTSGALNGVLRVMMPYGSWILNTKWNGNTTTPGAGIVNANADPVTPAGSGVTVEPYVVN